MIFFLPVRPPCDWAGIRAFLAARAIPGVEDADPAGLIARAEAGRPYRAYAAPHLWAADEAPRGP